MAKEQVERRSRKQETVPVSVRLTPEQIEGLEEFGRRTFRNRSGAVQLAVARFLEAASNEKAAEKGNGSAA